MPKLAKRCHRLWPGSGWSAIDMLPVDNCREIIPNRPSDVAVIISPERPSFPERNAETHRRTCRKFGTDTGGEDPEC